MAATEAVYCFCGKPYEINQFMIQCDRCKEWFHGSCVNVKEYQSFDIEKYFCCKCEPYSGPTVYKPLNNYHRHDYSDPHANGKPTQVGTTTFIRELKSRSFPNGDEIILRIRGQQLTLPFLNSNGFTQPILIPGKDGLDLNVPSDSFTVQDVENYVGSDRVIDVIDVTRQADLRMTLGEFVEYYTNPLRPKVYNVISLEFTDTSLSALVEPPYIARKLCWANSVWPPDWPISRPEVQKYCLMGVQESYTDFHIDFGGSSVWYHVLKGEKVFYFVPPTPRNLSLYQEWMSRVDHHEVFFGDMVDKCYRVVLQEGHTMLIPTGWIHAVYTPKDSLVFGGNFLHSLNIELQLQVYSIEKSTKAPDRFRFPFFQTMHWFASEKLVEDLKDLNSKSSRCPEYLLRGIRALLTAFQSWVLEKENGKGRSEPIPDRIVVPKLLKELSRELRHAERNSAIGSGLVTIPTKLSLAKPVIKPEKEPSKRIRRKPQARADFVDINEALSNFAAEEGRLAMKSAQEKKTSNPSYLSNAHKQQSKVESLPLKILLPKRLVGLNDDDEEKPLMIDEKKSSSKNKPAKVGDQHRGPIKLRLSVGGRAELQLAETTEVAANIDIETGDDVVPPKKGGIDELLRASSMPRRESMEAFESTGRTSPSTREAIVGMLTMSQGFASPNSSDHSGTLSSSQLDHSAPPSVPVVQQKQRKGRRRLNTSLSDDYSDVVSKVHQDDEYIYPSLDASDDELYDYRDAKNKRPSVKLKHDDESWNPRARVGKVLPKTDRPVREGTKRPAVERVLEAAAQKRAHDPPAKRAYIRRMKRASVGDSPQAEAGSSATLTATAATNSVPPPPSPAPLGKAETNKAHLVKKPKKGMATAKQRLGKILKIHKMVH